MLCIFVGVVYTEFPTRRPPPSYNASQTQQQHRHTYPNLPSNQHELPSNQTHRDQDEFSLPSSPPPTYRSRTSTTRTGVSSAFPHPHADDFPASRPPTYRSHVSDVERPHVRSVLARDRGTVEARRNSTGFTSARTAACCSASSPGIRQRNIRTGGMGGPELRL